MSQDYFDECQKERDDRRNRERYERRRYEVAKALYVRMLERFDKANNTYHNMACEAITAAEEFLDRLDSDQPVLVEGESE